MQNQKEFKDIIDRIDDRTFVDTFVRTIWAKQTEKEQEKEETEDTNMQGFNKPDGRFFGKWIHRIDAHNELPWIETINEMRHRMLKYWGQF